MLGSAQEMLCSHLRFHIRIEFASRMDHSDGNTSTRQCGGWNSAFVDDETAEAAS